MTQLVAATLLANLLVLSPLWLRGAEPAPPWLALEAVIIVGAIALLPRRRGDVGRLLVALGLVLAVLTAFADAVTHQVLGRDLNLYLDVPLLRSVYHLLAGVAGPFLAIVACVAAVLALMFSVAGLGWVLGKLQGVARTRSARVAASAMLLGGGALAAAALVPIAALPRVAVPLVDTVVFQAEQVAATHRARGAFRRRLAGASEGAHSLDRLAGRDVLLVFVESYGAGILHKAPWRNWLGPRLADMDEHLSEAGLSVVSGTMASPIRGGQSWLAHATTLSGLRIDNQRWYRLLLASGRSTLVDDFQSSGHRTVTVMPAITMAWPEGRAYGFDAIHDAAALDYAGPALNWVTMPDQYTLHRFQQRIREPASQPLFAQIALISSHAPWTPILPVLDDWASVGDGSVYGRWENAGIPPSVLWRDMDRVRQHHAMSLDYSLGVLGQWAADFVDEKTLLIVLGDHPAAPLVSGEDAGPDVPVHVISGDPALLAPFQRRGFASGTWPGPQSQAPRAGLEQLRGWLAEGFATPEPVTTAAKANMAN